MTVPGRRARLLGHAGRQAAEDAVRVHEPLDLVARRGERVGHLLVHDEHGAVLAGEGARSARRASTGRDMSWIASKTVTRS